MPWTKAIYTRKNLFGLLVQGVGVHGGVMGVIGGSLLERGLRTHISNHKLEAEWASSKWHKSFEVSKLTPCNIPPPRRPHLLTFSKQPPNGDQVFNCSRLMEGTSHFYYFSTGLHFFSPINWHPAEGAAEALQTGILPTSLLSSPSFVSQQCLWDKSLWPGIHDSLVCTCRYCCSSMHLKLLIKLF